MANQFKAGDVVQLKSGGPKMTVDKVDGEKIWCTWFANDQPQRSPFPAEAIDLFR